MTEFGTIDDPQEPAATLGCVCGNYHFFPSTEEGFVLGDATNTKENLIPWPDTHYVHALCPECGRLYSDEELETTGKARVLKIVNLEDPARQKNILAHTEQ